MSAPMHCGQRRQCPTLARILRLPVLVSQHNPRATRFTLTRRCPGELGRDERQIIALVEEADLIEDAVVVDPKPKVKIDEP